ncbi:hypothetical protein, partial [Sphaerochaeta associata]|uniref:hypothetical protein n=1 Tax=Sphaerochaeta associata TaxID=1129264 RepID=UPI0024B755B0
EIAGCSGSTGEKARPETQSKIIFSHYIKEHGFKYLKRKWWENEKLAYMFDNEGNRADSPDYNPDDAWFENDE